jgi:hypothetical protein
MGSDENWRTRLSYQVTAPRLARVVVAILAFWSTVQVNDHIEAVVPSPANGIIQVRCLPLGGGMWAQLTRRTPSADRGPNVVGRRLDHAGQQGTRTGEYGVKECVPQPRTGNLREVIVCDPSVPVVHKSTVCPVVILVLAECPLIDNSVVPGVLEQGRLWEESVCRSLVGIIVRTRFVRDRVKCESFCRPVSR